MRISEHMKTWLRGGGVKLGAYAHLFGVWVVEVSRLEVEADRWKRFKEAYTKWDADEDGISPCPNCHGSGKAKDQTYW